MFYGGNDGDWSAHSGCDGRVGTIMDDWSG